MNFFCIFDFKTLFHWNKVVLSDDRYLVTDLTGINSADDDYLIISWTNPAIAYDSLSLNYSVVDDPKTNKTISLNKNDTSYEIKDPITPGSKLIVVVSTILNGQSVASSNPLEVIKSKKKIKTFYSFIH